MSLASAFLILTQSATPAAAEAPASRAAPVAEQVRASATILRPARVSISRDGAVEVEGTPDRRTVQRSRDAAGTVWVEFS
ncbi:MAG: hypothetical protein ACX930_15150 [Erythrobacter sp.]